MKIYLAGDGWGKRLWIKDGFFDFFRLTTVYKIDKTEPQYINKYKDFLLDSGAFSFFGGIEVNWNDYVDNYIAFINKYNVKNFIELDLYSIIGTEQTERIREKIENKTGRKTIPVFHKRLGIDYYKKICQEYDYVSISASGKYESKWTRKEPERLIKMINYANANQTRVHGLGYTCFKMFDRKFE